MFRNLKFKINSKFKIQNLKLILKKIYSWETYENLLIGFLKFLIKRNPISPFYALVVILKQKLKTKQDNSLDSCLRRNDKGEHLDPRLREDDKNKNNIPLCEGSPEGVLKTTKITSFKQRYKFFRQKHKTLKNHFSSHHPYLSASSSALTIFLLIGGVAFYLFTNYASQAQAWWNDDWHYRKSITINSSQVTADQTNFPMLVSFTDGNLISKAQTDGDDIIFITPNGEKLDHEIESFDSTTGALVAWVRIPELDGDNNSSIFMYYGNQTADNQQNGEGVWDENYVSVWHMNSGATAGENDSTRSGYNLGVAGTVGTTDTGRIGKSREITVASINNYLFKADDKDLDGMQKLTIQAWVRDTQGDATVRGIISKRTDTNSNVSYSTFMGNGGSRIFSFDNGNSDGTMYDSRTVTDTEVGLQNTWQMLHFTFDGTLSSAVRKSIYLNGANAITGTANQTTITDTASDLRIGILNDGYSSGWKGQFDEVRIIKDARSADWITTEYNNQNSPATFISLGAEERGNAPVLYLPFDEGFGTTAHDETSYRNDGTIVGATWKNEEDCRSGKCLEFDGTGDYVEIADNPSLSLKEELTLEAWVKPNNTNLSNQTIIAKTETPNDPTKIYRSVGPSATTAIAVGTTNAMTIIGDRATFATALPDNVGVGDVIQYDADNDNDIDASDSLAFIIERISNLEYRVSNVSGGAPVSVNNDNNWSLFRSYTSLANAENGTENTGIDADLQNFDTWSGGKDIVASNEEWNIVCYANGTTADGRVGFVNWITSESSYLKIYTPVNSNEVGISQRHSGKWDTSKYYLSYSGNNFLSEYSVDNLVIEGLQLSLTNASDKASMEFIASTGGKVIIRNNVFKSDDAVSVYGIYIGASISNFDILNNVFYNFSLSGIHDQRAGNYQTNIYNNTFYNCGIYSRGNALLLKNNVVNSNGANYSVYSGFSFNVASTNNISNDATAPGANSKINTTVSFVSTTAGSEDFHLSPTDTAAKDAGADLSGDSVFLFATDIDGQSRDVAVQRLYGDAWDIGADEARVTQIYRSVGPGKTDALETGDGNALTIVGNTATFQRALADNVGVGDALQYDVDSDGDIDASDKIVFITGRISNFQYTISNASGGLPTEVVSDNDWSLFRAYTSLANAEAGTENTGIDSDLRNFDTWTGGKDLVTSKEQWNIACYANGTTADTVAVSVSGWTLSSLYKLRIYTPVNINEVGVNQRHNGTWSDDKYKLDISSGQNAISVPNNAVKIEGLQVKLSSSVGMGGAIYNIYSGLSVSDCYIETTGNTTGGILSETANGTSYIWNNILKGNSSYHHDNNSGIYIHNGTTEDISYIYNNTVIGFSQGIRANAGHPRVCVNNLAKGQSDVSYTINVSTGSDYNASDDGTSTGGANDKINQTFSFVDESGGDYHLAPTDTVARNAGVDLSEDAYIPMNTDIDGNTRNASSSSWDIGADEVTATKIYRSVGPGNTSALATDESHENTVSVTAGVATFSAGLADRIGVGDAVLIDTNADNAITSADTLLFIHGRNSSVSYDLRTHTGAMPADIAENDTYQIYRAYTSLFNAEAGTENTAIPVTTFNGGDRDLVTNNEEWNIACYGDAVDGNNINFSGWITGEENNIKIYTPNLSSEVGIGQRHQGKWGSGYMIKNGQISISIANIIFEGISTRNNTILNGYLVTSTSNSTGFVTIKDCFIWEDLGSDRDGIFVSISESNTKYKFLNNIIKKDNTDSSRKGIRTGGSSLYYIYNNTVIHNGNIGIESISSNSYVANNLVYDYANTGNCFSGTFANMLKNASTDSTADNYGGTGNKVDQTFTFRDAANDDFRLAMTDTAAKGAGLNLTYDANLPITNDIEGELRPDLRGLRRQTPEVNAFDIGADQISGTTHDNYSLTLNRDYPQTTFSTSENDQDNFSSGDINLEANTWSHLVYKRNADSEEMFINGSKKDSGTISDFLKTNGGKLYLGAENQNSKNSFKGLMDEIRIYNYARTETEVKKDTTAGSSGRAAARASEGVSVAIGDKSPTLTDGLVGYWKMDETIWNGTAGEVVDASGNENHGVRSGDATTGAGKYGNGGIFDGTGDYIDTSMANLSEFTYSAWVYRNSSSGDQPVIGGQNANGSAALFITNANAVQLQRAGYATIGSAISPIVEDEWFLATVTYNTAGDYAIYINGELDTSGNNLQPMGKDLIRIGAHRESYYTNGKLDEVRIYNRALSVDEVKKLYEYAPGPVLHLKMDEKVAGDAQTLNDISGNENNGTTVDGANNIGMDCSKPGKLGSACEFDGVDDYVGLPNVGSGFGDITWSFWIKLKGNQAYGDGIMRYSSNFSPAIGFATSNVLGMNTRYSGNWCSDLNSTFGLVPETWYYVAITSENGVSSHERKIYINGSKNVSNICAGGVRADSGGMNFLGSDGSIKYFNGQIDDVKIYNYARTQEQILEDMSAGNPALGKPILDLDFNEGFGATAHDKSGNGNDGTLVPGATGANTTATMMWDKGGKFGGAMEFDGTNDYVDAGLFEVVEGKNALTISAWVKWGGAVNQLNGRANIIGKEKAISFRSVNTGHKIFLDLNINDTWVNSGESASVIDDGEWHHVVGFYDGTYIKIYVDGVEENRAAHAGNITTSATNYNLTVGNIVNIQHWNGEIDEVKIYNYALGEDEIKTLYNNSASMVMGGGGASADNNGTTVTGDNAKYCVPGDTAQCDKPVLELAMDEKTGLTAYDTSGNGNNGTLTNGPTWGRGAFGSAVSFDGVNNNYVTLSYNSSLNLQNSGGTVSAWIKLNSDNIGQNDVWPIYRKLYHSNEFVGNGIKFEAHQGGVTDPIYLQTRIGGIDGAKTHKASKTILTKDKWYFVSMSWDVTNIYMWVDGSIEYKAPVDFSLDWPNNVGSVIAKSVNPASSTSLSDGLIDYVRVYNYARTPAQIAWDYNHGKPVAHWEFDEGEGVTVHDESGNGNHGTMTGATWRDESECKNGKCLYFDGLNTTKIDVDVPDNMNNFTACSWIRANALTNADNDPYMSIFDKGWDFRLLDNGKLKLYVPTSGSYGNIETSQSLNVNEWYRTCGVFKGIGVMADIYVNGVKQTLTVQFAGTGNQADDSVNILRIGAPRSNDYYANFNGLMDDLKIYNYALTPEQVKLDYAGGAALKFE